MYPRDRNVTTRHDPSSVRMSEATGGVPLPENPSDPSGGVSHFYRRAIACLAELLPPEERESARREFAALHRPLPDQLARLVQILELKGAA